MKLTTERLKRLIREELNKINENFSDSEILSLLNGGIASLGNPPAGTINVTVGKVVASNWRALNEIKDQKRIAPIVHQFNYGAVGGVIAAILSGVLNTTINSTYLENLQDDRARNAYENLKKTLSRTLKSTSMIYKTPAGSVNVLFGKDDNAAMKKIKQLSAASFYDKSQLTADQLDSLK